MENDVSKVASIKRQHIRHARLHFFAAGYHSRSLSYTILLEEVLAEKKCPQKHGGFSPEMTPLPWLLVPPAHEKTTDQAQN